MPRNRSWYEIKNAADGTEATIYMYDEISSWGVTANQFCQDLMGLTAPKISLRINSPGGSVFDGVTIYSALKRHTATINVQVDGLAASIASIIAMAGDSITMAKNSMMMIHNAWSACIGNANEMAKMADVLGKIDSQLVDTYSERTGNDKLAIKQMMNEETWMTAEEAMKMGFCDCVGTNTCEKASFDLSKFQNAPARAVAMYAMPHTERDIEHALRDAGLSNRAAKIALSAIKKDHRDDDPNNVVVMMENAASEYRLIKLMKG